MLSQSKILERRNKKAGVRGTIPPPLNLSSPVVEASLISSTQPDLPLLKISESQSNNILNPIPENKLSRCTSESLHQFKKPCLNKPSNMITERSLSSPIAFSEESDLGFLVYLRFMRRYISKFGKPPRVVAFDFDQTITLGHTRGVAVLSDDESMRLSCCYQNIRSPDIMKSFFAHLIRGGIDIWIASYATTASEKRPNVYSGGDLISEYLKALYKDSECPIPKEKIIAFQTGILCDGFFNACKELNLECHVASSMGKSVHLSMIEKRLNMKDPKRICLIDDDNDMIKSVSDRFSAINILDIFHV